MIRSETQLKLALPQTNYQGAAEHLMLAWLGACVWSTLAKGLGVDLSALRDRNGQEVYATFFYIECLHQPDSTFRNWNLDETVQADVETSSYKKLLIDSKVILSGCDGKRATFRMGNIFITPRSSNAELKISPPANGDFSNIATLPDETEPFMLKREFTKTRSLGVVPPATKPLNTSSWSLQLSPERDTNGAGLVYFANYFVYMNMALRSALRLNGSSELPGVLHRRLVYLRNIEPDDRVLVETTSYGSNLYSQLLRREADGSEISYSEFLLEARG